MDGFTYGVLIGCVCLTSAALSIIPLILLSPLILFRGGPTILLSAWVGWLSMLAYGLGYVLCSGTTLYLCIYRRTFQLGQHHSYQRARREAEKAFVSPARSATPPRPSQAPPRPILTPRSSVSGTRSSVHFVPKMPNNSRRPSIQKLSMPPPCSWLPHSALTSEKATETTPTVKICLRMVRAGFQVVVLAGLHPLQMSKRRRLRGSSPPEMRFHASPEAELGLLILEPCQRV